MPVAFFPPPLRWAAPALLLASSLAASPAATLARLPLAFEPNHGQAPAGTRFLARAPGYTVFLGDDGPSLALRGTPASAVRLRFVGARPSPAAEGQDLLAGRSNYYRSNYRVDGVPHYQRAALHGVYPGIDVVYYGNNRQLEWDLLLAPGADPRRILLATEGGAPRLTSAGTVEIRTPSGPLVLERPVAWQVLRGRKEAVEVRYRIRRDNRIALVPGRYDRARPLIIDPVLSFATYLGGAGVDAVTAMVTDGLGNAYLAGYTTSVNFPITPGAYREVRAGFEGTEEVFVAKMNSTGTQLLFSTYLGGENSERPIGIGVDPGGNVIVAGNTSSPDFPTAGTPLQQGGAGIFLSKLSVNGGTLLTSTFFGGEPDYGVGEAIAMAIDPVTGDVYLAGRTAAPNFRLTPGAAQTTLRGASDAFVARIANSLSTVVYSTLIGGDGAEQANAVAVDLAGNAYLTGSTNSALFPVTPGAYVPPVRGGTDAFFVKIPPNGSSLALAGLLGGSADDSGTAVAASASGGIYVAGTTLSSDFPTTPGAFQFLKPAFATPGFLARLGTDGTARTYATYLGAAGSYFDLRAIRGLFVDGGENAHVAGSGFGSGFPVTPGAVQGYAGFIDGFFLKMNPAGEVATYSTYLGGGGDDIVNAMSVDALGNVYLAGSTTSTNFPATTGAIQGTSRGQTDGFLAKIDMGLNPINCVYSITPASLAADIGGTSGSFQLTTGAACLWTASTAQSWIAITSATTGAGPAAITFTVAANTARTARNGSIAVAGQTFAISQAAAPCTYAVEPASRTLPSSTSVSSFTVTTLTGCAWTVTSNAAWLRTQGGSSGSGTGNAQFVADENPTGAARTGSLTIAGQVVQILQQPALPAQVFTDVPVTHPYFDSISLLRQYGVTGGCTAAAFCPDGETTRGQMAVFIVRSLQGGDVFPYPTVPYFTDVPPTHPYFAWVQRLRELGITSGCSATDYCPDAPVTRGEMAVFLVRGRLRIRAGQTFSFPATQFFTDVPAAHPYFSFVQKLRELGVTTGCNATEYCVGSGTTRGQMAVFLIRSFFTP